MLRIIDDPPRPATFNMAADLYLLKKAAENQYITVRTYQWATPTVSLGYMQNPLEVLDMHACEELGAFWIRRPTGGRAVFHHQDVTYSCVFSRDIKMMGASVADTYGIISQCLMRGLLRLGISCENHDCSLDIADARSNTKLPCFLAPNRNEIMAQGRKLIGSAQKRSAEGTLQHGAIPMTGAFRALPRILRIDPEHKKAQAKLLHERCACITELSPRAAASDVSSAIVNGFAEALQCKPKKHPWTQRELQKIADLSASNTFRRQWLSEKPLHTR